MIDIQISHKVLNPKVCIDFVRHDNCGAVNLFVGTVRCMTTQREVSHLEFEAYEPMAIAEMRKIAVEIMERWTAEKVCIQHRVGKLEIGEIAVMIAVSTPHRKDSFVACEYAIDTLKKTVPIWKKEVFLDGEVWVAAHP